MSEMLLFHSLGSAAVTKDAVGPGDAAVHA